MDSDDALQLIEDCEDRESRMSEWERDFVDSVKSQLGRGRSLSQKQTDVLETVWEKVTNKG